MMSDKELIGQLASMRGTYGYTNDEIHDLDKYIGELSKKITKRKLERKRD